MPAGEYLSGNVRRKLREAQRAAESDPAYRPNVDALLRAQPRDLDASEIEVRLGATWIPVEYYQKFMRETFRTPSYLRNLVTIRYSPVTSEWSIENKNRVSRGDVMARATWGTERVSAYENMLAVLNTGKALSIDQRLVNPAWPDDPRSKVNVCVREVLKHWEEGRAEKTVQLIFLDTSTPKPGGGFSLYRDIKDKLVAGGVPESEIAFIHDAETDLAKQELFARVRSGAVRVFIGSTAKCGTGMNVQDKVQYLIHMDVPYRCSDNIQREGRAVRQGNEHGTVHIVNILTEGTTEAFSYEILQRKSAFVEQFLGGNGALRSCEDIGESTMTYAELKSIAVGDERIRERMKLDLDVTKLKIVRADWIQRRYRLEDQVLNYSPAEIRKAEATVDGIQADVGVLETHPLPADGFAGMTVQGVAYDEKAAAGQALMDAAAAISTIEPEEIGSYRGFRLSAYIDGFGYSKIAIQGKVTYTLEMGDSAIGNIQRLDNALARIPDELAKARTALEDLRRQMENARDEAAKPFEHERELADKTMRLMALDAEIGRRGKPPDESRPPA